MSALKQAAALAQQSHARLILCAACMCCNAGASAVHDKLQQDGMLGS